MTNDDDDDDDDGDDDMYIPLFPISEVSMLGFCKIRQEMNLEIVPCHCADYTGRLVLP